MIGLLVICIVILFLPPLGVFFLTGCGADLLINICLTIFGYFPGHIHGYYLAYQYKHRRDAARRGAPITRRAGGIYSERVQTGGISTPVAAQPAVVGQPVY